MKYKLRKASLYIVMNYYNSIPQNLTLLLRSWNNSVIIHNFVKRGLSPFIFLSVYPTSTG